MMNKLKSWINQFSFFEYIGLLTFVTIISNYFLDQPLIKISVFFGYCVVGFMITVLKLSFNYKKFIEMTKR